MVLLISTHESIIIQSTCVKIFYFYHGLYKPFRGIEKQLKTTRYQYNYNVQQKDD